MPRPPKFSTVARRNNRRDTLIAARDKIAKTLDGSVAPRDLSPLIRQLRDIEAEIASLPVPEKNKVLALLDDEDDDE